MLLNGTNNILTDWHQTWLELQKKWSEDIACPDGVFNPFDIDATINSAYVAMALLYGNGDYTKTLDIAARCRAGCRL